METPSPQDGQPTPHHAPSRYHLVVALVIIGLIVAGIIFELVHSKGEVKEVATVSAVVSKANTTQPITLKGKSATDWHTLIPQDMEIVKEANGDVNKDGIKDVVLALRNKNDDGVGLNPETSMPTVSGQKYYDGLFLVILGSKEGMFTVAVSSNTMMTPLKCADLNEPLDTIGDPLTINKAGDIVFKQFNFSGEHGYQVTETFHFDKGVWLLIKETIFATGVGNNAPTKTTTTPESELKGITIENYHAPRYDAPFCEGYRNGK